MDTDSLIEIPVCDLWHVGLLRSDTSRQDKMLGDGRTLASGRLETNVPALGGRVIVCGLDLCRVDDVEVKGLDVSRNLRRQITSRKKVRCLELLVVA